MWAHDLSILDCRVVEGFMYMWAEETAMAGYDKMEVSFWRIQENRK
jgi:hypothetical protein